MHETDAELARIIATHATALTHITGVGTMVASQLRVTLGGNPNVCVPRRSSPH